MIERLSIAMGADAGEIVPLRPGVIRRQPRERVSEVRCVERVTAKERVRAKGWDDARLRAEVEGIFRSLGAAPDRGPKVPTRNGQVDAGSAVGSAVAVPEWHPGNGKQKGGGWA